MQLWKIIDQIENQALESTGKLVTAEKYVDEHFRNAYRWMARQMQHRLGPSPNGVLYPQWAWLHWSGVDKKRPDLRTVRHRVPKGKHFLLELDMSDERVLISDFERWHYVLNGWNLTASSEDSEEFEMRNRRERMAEMERSWEAIFDISDSFNPELWGKPNQWSLQATFWELRLDDVKSRCPFKSGS